MNELEKAALATMLENAKENPKLIEKLVVDHLTYKENKKIVKAYLKDQGKDIDTRTELVTEKQLDDQLAEKYREDAEAADRQHYDAIKGEKARIDADVGSKRQEIMKEIEEYNPHCSNITYSTLFSAMNAHIGKQKTHVINKGKQGIGKSRGTSELVKKLDLPDAQIISGYMTPKKLYETLKRYRHATIILDESEMIMNDPQALFILRSALYGGQVAWLTTKGDTADAFQFSGTLIANMNHFGITEAESSPLFDRTLFNENNLDNQQTMDKIKSTTQYKPKEDIWKLVKDRITILRAEGLRELTLDEEKKVMDDVEALVKGASVFNKSISTRSIHRARLVAKCLKNFYGDLEGEIWPLAENLIRPYVVTTEAADLCVRLLHQNPALSRLELTELVAEHKQCSERQASRLLKAAIEKGSILAVNRNTVKLP